MTSPAKTLESALQIIEKEITKLSKMSNLRKTKPLDRQEANSLAEYIRVLIIARKDEREESKGEKLPQKSDNELEALAQEALTYLQSQEKK